MTALEKHHTAKELARQLKEKTGFGCERTLAKWREQRHRAALDQIRKSDPLPGRRLRGMAEKPGAAAGAVASSSIEKPRPRSAMRRPGWRRSA